jgi:hypothetical protein
VTRAIIEALSSREAGSGAVQHVAPPEPSRVRRRGPELWGHVTALEAASAGRQGMEPHGTWQCVDVRTSPCLGLKLVCGVPGLQVPTVAPGSISGEVVNPQVRSTL